MNSGVSTKGKNMKKEIFLTAAFAFFGLGLMACGDCCRGAASHEVQEKVEEVKTVKSVEEKIEEVTPRDEIDEAEFVKFAEAIKVEDEVVVEDTKSSEEDNKKA